MPAPSSKKSAAGRVPPHSIEAEMHVLGAAMFMIEIAGVRVLYTGDFSREEDRHLMAAELPSASVRPGSVATLLSFSLSQS